MTRGQQEALLIGGLILYVVVLALSILLPVPFNFIAIMIELLLALLVVYQFMR
jgi:hypothetical protein